MRRFLLDLEIESDASLKLGLTELHVSCMADEIEVFVSPLKDTPGEEGTLLSVQIVLNSDDLKHAQELGLKKVRELLCAWSFATNMPFRIANLRRIVDWTPGLQERDCIQYFVHPAYDRPYKVLDQECLATAARIADAPLSSTLRRALRWFANGVSSTYPDDQFYYFWLAIELVAVETKLPDPVNDACPKCRGPLFCQTCNLHSMHKPYPKQAILTLFKKHIEDSPDKLFAQADRIRNALMHGDDLDVLQACTGVTLEVIVNSIGRLTWVALLSTIIAKLRANGESGGLPVMETNKYVNHQLKVSINISVTSEDPNCPRLDELPNFEGSLVFKPEEST
jgi:hypothetical protein